MPKLWRAPMPMVRITAPQITAIQKLRCCGLGADWAEGTDMEHPGLSRSLVTFIMIVTPLCCVNAAQELWQDVVSDRPQPGARRGVVEDAHHARRPARDDPLR